MTNTFYRIEIVTNPTAKGEAITRAEEIKRDLLMTSRRIALLKFEEHFEALQSGNLQKEFEEEGHIFAGDTIVSLSLYLIEGPVYNKKIKKILLQKVESIPAKNLDYDMKLLQAEQDGVMEMMRSGKLPQERPVEETFFFRQKVWGILDGKKKIIDIIEYPFRNFLDAWYEVEYFPRTESSNSYSSELYIVERDQNHQKQKEHVLSENGYLIFGIGFLIEKDAHWKLGFEHGKTGYFGNRRIPSIFPGILDKIIYRWVGWEGIRNRKEDEDDLPF